MRALEPVWIWLMACVALAGSAMSPAIGNAQTIAADQPQLTARGNFAVGVRRLSFTHPNQPDFERIGLTGIPKSDRVIEVEIWYPVARAAGLTEQIIYTIPTTSNQAISPDKLPAMVTYSGQAARNAEPVRGHHFPLVILSHGFTNAADGFSALAENLASKGYVVASIEHRDPDPYYGRGANIAIGKVISRRTVDQRFIIAQLTLQATAADAPLRDVYDPVNVALIGYSMGGFGAISSAGAGFSKDSPIYKSPLGKLIEPYTEGGIGEQDTALPSLKAMVLLAPWGGAQPYRAWSPAALGNIKVPTLVIDGDQDDIADFAGGVKYIYDNMTGSNRYLLVYENARHNIALNETPPELAKIYPYIEHSEEPVWRTDRILAINIHFITAFLDARLKADTAHEAFLHVPTAKSNDGVWPQAPDAKYKGDHYPDGHDEGAKAWPGFQRRWALGLELYHDGGK